MVKDPDLLGQKGIRKAKAVGVAVGRRSGSYKNIQIDCKTDT